MDIKILKDLFQLTIERGNLCNRHDQIIHKRIMVVLGLPKSGKVRLQSTIDRGNLRKILGIHCKKLTLIVRNLFSAGMAHSARYGETIHDRTGQPVSENLQEQAHFENFVMGSDATELVNQVRDQVRIRQKRMSSIAKSCTEHSIVWGMFMATTLNAATFMGKNFSTIQSVVKNHESLTLKQMFDVTAQLVNNQEEFNCLDKILYGKNSWTHLSLIHDEVVINLQSTKVYVFSDSVFCLGKVLQHPECNEAWKKELRECEPREATEIMVLSVESRQNSSGTFSQDSQRCSSVIILCDLLSFYGTNTRIFHRKNSFYVNVQ